MVLLCQPRCYLRGIAPSGIVTSQKDLAFLILILTLLAQKELLTAKSKGDEAERIGSLRDGVGNAYKSEVWSRTTGMLKEPERAFNVKGLP